MSWLKERAAVTGVGETEYTKGSGMSILALQLQASLRAIEDAGLSPKDIDGVIPYATTGTVAEDFITNFGIDDLRYSATTPMGGASCVASLQSAAMAVSTGVANHVLCVVGRNGYSGGRVGTRVSPLPQF
jgi:3-oxoacyl-[acyl-carrier-protein] synthase III